MPQVLCIALGNGDASGNCLASKIELRVFTDINSFSYLLHILPTHPIGMGTPAKCDGLNDST